MIPLAHSATRGELAAGHVRSEPRSSKAQAEGRDVDRAIRAAIEAGMAGVQDTLAFGRLRR
jgi:hypothetical protein